MSNYDLKQLITMWQREKLTPEQAIGQVLLHLEALANRIGELEKRTETRRRGQEKFE